MKWLRKQIADYKEAQEISREWEKQRKYWDTLYSRGTKWDYLK